LGSRSLVRWLAMPAVLGALGAGAARPAMAGAPWWNPSWSTRRELQVSPGRSNVPGKDVAAVSFFHSGRARKDLRDIRVVSDKGATRHKVIQGGPGDFARIAFEIVPGAGTYWVYYGNEGARAADTSWKLQRGLLLETRRYRGGNPGSLRGMKDLVRRSAPKLGADFVGQVFHGFNLFGPSESYVSVYRGIINAPESGEYTWVTSSDDASFMFVGGRLVVQWPGWHGAAGRARHQKKSRLDKGLHDFEYHHVNGSGPAIAAAYWKTPSGNKIVPIPQSAFPSISRARAKSPEIRGQRFVADYAVEGVDETFVAERYLARYRFRNTAKGLLGARVEWDFGDGITATGPHADHVYLVDGDYTVKMKVRHSGGTTEVANRVRGQRLWRRQAERRLGPRREFLALISSYDLEKLAPKSLKALYVIYESTEKKLLLDSVARMAIRRAAEVGDDLYFDSVMLLQNSLRGEGKAEDAVAVLRQAEARLKSKKNLRAKVIREIGDVLFYYIGDLDGALKEYDKVVGRYQGLEDNIVRVTKIKIGDIYRKKGDYDRAAAGYRDAEKLRLYKHSDQMQRIRKGMLAHTVEEYLRRKELDEADKAISLLEWEFPMEKLEGRSSLLRARIALARKNLEEAAKQLDDFVKVAPKSEYAPECLFIAAGVHMKIGRPDIARKYFEHLATEHRDSEYSAPAADKLKELGGAAAPAPKEPGQ